MTHGISESTAITVSIVAIVAGLTFIGLRYQATRPINFMAALLCTTVVAVVSGAANDADAAVIRTAIAGIFLFGTAVAVSA